MEQKDIIERIKKSFCELTKFKVRDNALEVITAYSTINNKFVSVFVTFSNNKIVVTDSGWIDKNFYETPVFEESEEILSRITSAFLTSYEVKITTDKGGTKYYYKTCEKTEDLPSIAFDLSAFIMNVVNSHCIQYKDEKEERERETFKREANDFLKANYNENVKLRSFLDDFKSIKFNAIVNKQSKLYLISYITGSNQYYFENDLRRSIVNFEIAERSKFKTVIKEKISIVNNKSEGYNPEKSAYIFDLLSEKTTREPIKWTEKERVLELI